MCIYEKETELIVRGMGMMDEESEETITLCKIRLKNTKSFQCVSCCVNCMHVNGNCVNECFLSDKGGFCKEIKW